MGLFFEDKKQAKQEQEKKQSGSIFERLIIVLVEAVVATLAWVGKYTLTNYVSMIKYAWQGKEGASEKRRSLGRIVAVLLVIIPLFLIYKIPFVRNLTLSKNKTVNLSQAAGSPEIAFPDFDRFIITEERIVFVLDKNPSIRYVTYSKESDDLILQAESGNCLLVPRGKTADIRSNDWPIFAVGFEDTVQYRLKGNHVNDSSVADTSSQIPIAFNPLYTSDSWAVFYGNWGRLQKVHGRNLPFSVEAKSDENAMICF